VLLLPNAIIERRMKLARHCPEHRCQNHKILTGLPQLTEFWLQQLRKWDLRSFCILRSVQWEFTADVSGQHTGSIFNGHAVFLNYLTVEDGTDRLSRNVGKKLPFCFAQNPKRAQIQTAALVLERSSA
jgi:hypothetical protein